jgi:hypothetical protein
MSKPRGITTVEGRLLSERFYTKGGKLFAKIGYGRRVMAGQEVGCHAGRYLSVTCNYRLYLVHRVVYFLHYGMWPNGVVDHINGDPLDNSPENLRDITQGQNTRSYSKAHYDSTSGYRGVHWFKRDGLWQSQIMCSGKKYHLGYFYCQREAALSWNYKASDLSFNKESYNNVF